MYHIGLICLSGTLLALLWLLVHSSPRTLSMVLPPRLTFGIGIGLFILALFSAFAAAHVMREPIVMLESFVQGGVGLWLMLATSASARGSYQDEQFLVRLFAMMAVVMGVIISSLYLGDARLMAFMNLILVAVGYLITRNFLRFLDRGR
jgi:hypothetical protein